MECVKKDNCGCFFKGRMYRKGEVRKDRCNNCTCVGGEFQCTDVNCEDWCAEQGLKYSDCGKTCENAALKAQDIRCEPGCFCPDGLVMSRNGTCVDPINGCQCKEANLLFPPGISSPSDCSKQCGANGAWITRANTTAKPQYDCAATGQMQYRTFDGKQYSFNGGKCEYVMVSNCSAINVQTHNNVISKKLHLM